MNDTLAKALSPHKNMLLTTFKKDGTPVPTPVTVAVEDGRIFFRTYSDAWKFKRMRRNPHVEVAPSTFRGKPLGPAMPGRVRRLEGDDVAVARRALARRAPLLQRFLVPLLHRVMRYTTIHYELTADNG
jgi:uncharacterized protein